MDSTRFPYSLILLAALGFFFTSCQKEEGCTDPSASNYEGEAEADDGSCEYGLSVRFRHNVNGKELQFNDKDYISADGDTFRISRLRYLISDLTLHRSGASDVRTGGHHLVRIAPNNSLTYVNDPDENPTFVWDPSIDAPEGDYEGISFNFGFDSEDNTSGAYSELNQASWAWPDMLGGGYHYMQFEGEYDSAGTATSVFNMHLGKARDTSGANTTYLNNHFHVQFDRNFSIEGNDNSLELVMDLGKWFTPPPASMDPGNGQVWDLEQRPKAVMPDYDSQRVLNANGRDVFSFDP
jgi:hypothetical protein